MSVTVKFNLERYFSEGSKQVLKERNNHTARGLEVDNWNFETQTLKFVKQEKIVMFITI